MAPLLRPAGERGPAASKVRHVFAGDDTARYHVPDVLDGMGKETILLFWEGLFLQFLLHNADACVWRGAGSTEALDLFHQRPQATGAVPRRFGAIPKEGAETGVCRLLHGGQISGHGFLLQMKPAAQGP